MPDDEGGAVDGETSPHGRTDPGSRGHGPLTTTNVAVGPDGSLMVQFIRPDTTEIVKIELRPGGGYSLLTVRGQTRVMAWAG